MKKEQHELVLMLGGNIGNTQQFFNEAIEMIQQSIGNIVAISQIYQTAPWGYDNQPDFLNMALKVETALMVYELMPSIQRIEQKLGKKPLQINGPRVIDIDVMFYNNLIVNTEEIIIPHPRLHLRKFNLIPLNQIIPDFVHPVMGQSIAELAKASGDELKVITKE